MQFRQDMTKTQLYAQRSPGHMMDVAMMAVLSIRQSWNKVGDQLLDVAKEGDNSRYLFGFKKQAYKYLDENGDWLYSVTMNSSTSDRDLLDAWTTVPGLGLAKAGFVCQLTRGKIGCLDSHNLKQYGIPASQLRYNKKLSVKALNLKLDAYIKLCEDIGGSEFLWKEWCYLMGAKAHTSTADDVSALHWKYLHRLDAYIEELHDD